MPRGQDDIERYFRGELSPEEMHALENQALSDPFLADALDGLASVNIDELDADLGNLRTKLSGRSRKVIPLWGWIASAAATISIGVLVVYIFTREPAEKSTIASKGGPEHVIADTLKIDTTAAGNGSEVPANATAETTQPRADQIALNDLQESRKAPSAPIDLPAIPEIASYDSTHETTVDHQVATLTPLAADSTPLAKMETYLLDRRTEMLTGRVIDAEDGRVLPGVNVSIPGTTVGTVTDEEGRYVIPLDSLSGQLQFSFIGYESKTVDAGASSTEILLVPDVAQLSEVVVVGYGTRDKDGLDTTPMVEPAMPDGGKKAFKEYLEKNLKYPEQALNHKVEGRVTVQFTVEATGGISNFTVLKGLGFGCEEEVIRLIQSGPKWRPTRKNTEPVVDKVKVRMKFTLPKK